MSPGHSHIFNVACYIMILSEICRPGLLSIVCWMWLGWWNWQLWSGTAEPMDTWNQTAHPWLWSTTMGELSSWDTSWMIVSQLSLSLSHACTKCTHNTYIFKNVHVIIYSAPILLDTNMSAVTTVQWNPTGSIIAFGGTQRFQDGKELCAVQFYNAFGVVILIE